MNISILKKTTGILILTLYTVAQTFAAPKESDHDDHNHSDHDGEEHGQQEHDDHEHESHDGHDGHDHSLFEEASLAELIHLIEQMTEQIESRSKGTSDEHLVEAVETLVDAAKHLPEKSGMLEENQLLRVKSAVVSMEKVALKIEAASGKGDKESVSKFAEQLHKLFGILKQQYPASISEGDHKENDHGHEGHEH